MITTMEYRTYIEMPTFPPGDRWEALYTWLDAHTDMGPAFSGPAETEPGLTIILATDADDEAGAVRATVDAVTRGLEAIGSGAHYPARVEVEPADASTPTRAAA